MKRLIVLLILLLPLFAYSKTCTNYNAIHSVQAHKSNICSCENCHIPIPAKGTAPTTCIGCHVVGSGRTRAEPTTPSHIPVAGIDCVNCHNVTSFLTANMNHTVVTGKTCETCHNKVQARGMPSDHIPTTATCSTCHNTKSWDGVKMNHTGITTGCATCHAKDKARQTNHIPTTASCESCHSNFSSFSGARYGHPLGTSEDCLSCHKVGINAPQKSPSHMPTTDTCIKCHDDTLDFKCVLLEKNYNATKLAIYKVKMIENGCSV